MVYSGHDPKGEAVRCGLAAAVVPLVAMDELSEKSKVCKQEVSVKSILSVKYRTTEVLLSDDTKAEFNQANVVVGAPVCKVSDTYIQTPLDDEPKLSKSDVEHVYLL